MKNVKLFLISMMILFGSFTYGQIYNIERDLTDTTKYRFCTYTTDKGSYSKNCTSAHTGDTVVMMVLQLAKQKRMYIEAMPWQKDIDLLDSCLFKSTGRVFAAYESDAMVKSLSGNWTLIHDSTEIEISIDKDLKIKGGMIKGFAEINEDKSITLNKVLPEPVILFIKNKELVGIYRKQPIVMKRQS